MNTSLRAPAKLRGVPRDLARNQVKREAFRPPAVPSTTLGLFRAALRRIWQRPHPSPPLIVQELAARHETLLAQVRAIDDSASARPLAVVAAERAVLRAAASSVLQELEHLRAGLGPDAD